jgi:glycosyltransferase involved in cell wall biosynthesis
MKKRVCVVSPLYHPSLGGLGRQAQILTEKLAEHQVPVFVIARRMKDTPQAVFSQKVRIYRAWSIRPRVHTFEQVSLINILISLTFSFSASVLLFLKRKEYEIVHFHGASLPLIVNLLLLKALRKKIIAKIASSNLGIEPGSLGGRYFGLGALLLRLFRIVDMFIATTSEIEEKLRTEGISASRVTRIPNFIDFTTFRPCPAEARNKAKTKIGVNSQNLVLFAGRFIECKGIEYLLKAWEPVQKIHTDAKLILLGDGPLFGRMKELCESLGISRSVIMKGHVENIVDYLHACDVYVLSSLHEGMPNSLLEAMACGLPPVATRIGGVIDIIEDRKNGLLVDAEDVSKLADGILALLADRNEAARIGIAAYQTIASSYSLDAIVPHYLRLYQKLKTD